MSFHNGNRQRRRAGIGAVIVSLTTLVGCCPDNNSLVIEQALALCDRRGGVAVIKGYVEIKGTAYPNIDCVVPQRPATPGQGETTERPTK
jgi:hypothetical protein